MTTNHSDVDTTGWTVDQCREYEAAMTELEEARAKEQHARALADVERRSPSHLIKLANEERLRLEEEAKAREAERLGEEHLALARTRYGRDKASLFLTCRGPIVLRAATSKELDEHALRVDALQNDVDRGRAWREFTADVVVYPPRAEFMSIMNEFPGTWPLLAAERDMLTVAVRAETAKKG